MLSSIIAIPFVILGFCTLVFPGAGLCFIYVATDHLTVGETSFCAVLVGLALVIKGIPGTAIASALQAAPVFVAAASPRYQLATTVPAAPGIAAPRSAPWSLIDILLFSIGAIAMVINIVAIILFEHETNETLRGKFINPAGIVAARAFSESALASSCTYISLVLGLKKQ